MRFVADFETNTQPDNCRVWAVGICDIADPELYVVYNDIKYLFKHFELYPNSIYYFHNLKFDGEFIIHYLLNNGFKYRGDKKYLSTKTFTTLISDKGQHYSYTIQINDKNKITINDSLKILPFKVSQISEAFGIEDKKLKIDYDIPRDVGHVLTPEERAYVINDVKIVAYGLQTIFDNGLNKITQGSNALYDFKNMFGKKEFKKTFPVLDYFIDKDIRQAYRGGFTYLNPKYKGLINTSGIVLDVNSLYPYVMYSRALPYGEPIFFEGKYSKDDLYNVYIQHINVCFELKKDYIPTIQLKNNLAFVPTEYLVSSNGEMVELYLTNIDLQLLKSHYDIIDIEYINGWKFKSHIGFFTEYIDKWISIKNESTITGNKALRTLAKLMLNALYGKFGLNPNVCSKIPYLKDNIVKYSNGTNEIRDSIYVPLAIFVTSYARFITICSAQQVYERFIYADTDSLHLIGTELPKDLDVDKVKLGAWKIEEEFIRGKYLRQKCYCEEILITEKEYNNLINGDYDYKNLLNKYNDKYTQFKITVAGMSDKCYTFFDFDKFEIGQRYQGKLQYQHIDGGIWLKPIDFTLKA